jgi:hypothetical protein
MCAAIWVTALDLLKKRVLLMTLSSPIGISGVGFSRNGEVTDPAGTGRLLHCTHRLLVGIGETQLATLANRI